jgi:hypothetical protein
VAERDARRLVRDRERLAALEPGGDPARPLDVATPAVIEGRARAMPCVQCGGELEILEHATVPDPHRSLRVIRARCRRCHAPRAIYFGLPAAPS